MCEGFGGHDGEKLHKPFALLCAALYVWMADNIGMICNEFWDPKSIQCGWVFFFLLVLFLLKPSFWEPHESLNAATITPLRGGSELQGAPGPFLLPSP